MGTLFPATTDGTYREPYWRSRSPGEGPWYRFVRLCVYGFFTAGATLVVAFGLAVMPPMPAVPHLSVNSLAATILGCIWCVFGVQIVAALRGVVVGFGSAFGTVVPYIVWVPALVLLAYEWVPPFLTSVIFVAGFVAWYIASVCRTQPWQVWLCLLAISAFLHAGAGAFLLENEALGECAAGFAGGLLGGLLWPIRLAGGPSRRQSGNLAAPVAAWLLLSVLLPATGFQMPLNLSMAQTLEAPAWARPERPRGKMVMVKLAAPPPRGAAEPVELTDGDYPGVVLWPDSKNTAQAPPRLNSPWFQGGNRPIELVFTGEYWFLRANQVRPPANSYFRPGDPLSLGFHSTDGAPLQAEARQQLDPPASIADAGAIRVFLSIADRMPASLSYELILQDTHSSGGPWQSLGIANPAVVSGSEQSVVWQIPNPAKICRFDQVRFVFHRELCCADRSPRLAIRRMIIEPAAVPTRCAVPVSRANPAATINPAIRLNEREDP